ncbi:MAG: VIT1/CCC1 transporter family protein [Candidatus Omnitrophica bacterium]|nr:VIT1/CCC1 transporter family protein [Candidatus Omnitrophota bacterium]
MTDKELLLRIQKDEITEHYIYTRLAELSKIEEHRRILKNIAKDELSHYEYFKGLTGQDSSPNTAKAVWFVAISRYLGLNFGLKLMESGETLAQKTYSRLEKIAPGISKVIRDEEKHENELISMLKEDSLKYISSVVLGLNDALVELTGALAGFTLALGTTRVIGMVGLITGLSAAMSMASSEYLSTKSEETDKNPLKASIYTGITYAGTVIILISPYFFFSNVFIALTLAIISALVIMMIFTYYISVAQEVSFNKRFFEMAFLSLSIAAISFLIGIVVKKVLGVEI